MQFCLHSSSAQLTSPLKCLALLIAFEIVRVGPTTCDEGCDEDLISPPVMETSPWFPLKCSSSLYCLHKIAQIKKKRGEGGFHTRQITSSPQGWRWETNTHSHCGQFRIINSLTPDTCRWEEARVLRGNRLSHRENMETPHRNILNQSNLVLPCCEATVLSTAPLRCPSLEIWNK